MTREEGWQKFMEKAIRVINKVYCMHCAGMGFHSYQDEKMTCHYCSGKGIPPIPLSEL